MNGSSSGGVGLTTALTLLFIGLKLGHAISWSWWWVLSPIWISALLSILILLIFAIVMAVTGASSTNRSRRR